MARDPRLFGLRRALVTHRNGWVLAAVLAILGILLGAQQLSRAADLAGQALHDAMRLVLDAGWLLLLLGAAGLAARLAISRPRGRATAQRLRWLRGRLTTRPVLVGTATAGLLVVLVLVVVVVPPRFTANRQFKTASEELKAQNDVRTTLLQGLGALLVLTGAAIGASVTYRGVRETRRQIALTAAANEAQLTLAFQGQITDRYTKAVDQLGSDHLDVRVGGIYALERIARNSPPDRAAIEEVLTAYVRDHAPWPPPPTFPSLQAIIQRLVTFAQRQRSALQWWKARDTVGQDQDQKGGQDKEGAEPQGPPADVQAAVTVLGRRQLPPDGLRRLDLTGVDLRRAVISSSGPYLHANFEEADFSNGNLSATAVVDLALAVVRGELGDPFKAR